MEIAQPRQVIASKVRPSRKVRMSPTRRVKTWPPAQCIGDHALLVVDTHADDPGSAEVLQMPASATPDVKEASDSFVTVFGEKLHAHVRNVRVGAGVYLFVRLGSVVQDIFQQGIYARSSVRHDPPR